MVVPAFALGGGVPAVARFVHAVARASGRYDVDVLSLATARDDGASVRLFRPATWFGGPKISLGSWADISFAHVGAVLTEFEFQRYRSRLVLNRLLASYDLIQVVAGTPAWANAVVGADKPVALQVATLARVERRARAASREGFGPWRRAMTAVTARLDDRALRRVDAIQVENPWMLRYAGGMNFCRDVDVRYAPPGVDSRVFRPVPSRDPARDPYVLCVGRLDDRRKNVMLLLEAFAQLGPRLNGETRLVLAGSAGPPPAFWSRASALGVRDRITLVVKPDDAALLALYQQASVFVLPSDEEGFGMVLIEAMACGIPVVATRCGGPEGIITDGEDGHLVPRDDPAAMAERIARLLRTPSLNQSMGAKARATVERCYDERVAGEAFLATWDRLLDKPRIPQRTG